LIPSSLLRGIEGVLARQWRRFDLTLVHEEVGPLLELRRDPEILAHFERLYAKLHRRLG